MPTNDRGPFVEEVTPKTTNYYRAVSFADSLAIA